MDETSAEVEGHEGVSPGSTSGWQLSEDLHLPAFPASGHRAGLCPLTLGLCRVSLISQGHQEDTSVLSYKCSQVP